MSGIILNFLVVVFISYGMSKLLESYFGKELSLVPVGFFCYLGILQIFNYALVTIGLNSKIYLVLYLTLGLVPYVIGFIKKIDFKPTKLDLMGLMGGFVFIGLGIFKSMNTTLGLTHFDTSFYMSLVNEKSVATQIGGPFSIHFYSGVTQPIDPTYDYQAFYIFEAMIIKLLRTLHLVEASGSVNYIWSASISFYLMMGMTLVNFFKLLFKDKKVLGILWLTLGAYLFFFKYYDLVFAFYGNSWRIMVISYLSYYIHLYLKEEDIKYSILIGMVGTGLIAFSSSGGFMMAFIGATLMIYSMFTSDSLKHYLISMIPLIFTLPYLIIVLCGMSKVLGIAIGTAVMLYVIGVLLYSKKA
ncbi:MAG: hypothetical protein HUJ56_05000, partial [Erysipelotrichaceae bacterium]|nr:hypothetical protein [Erysipelotrichaceae bacterium]